MRATITRTVLSVGVLVIALGGTHSAQGQPTLGPTWTALDPVDGPPAVRGNSSAVYDPTSDTMVVFGGSAVTSGAYNDAWLLTHASGIGGAPKWVPLNETFPAGPRSGHSAVYDAATNQMIVFGGAPAGGDACAAAVNDLWSLSHANAAGGTPVWTRLTADSPSPAPRQAHSAVYNPGSGRMIVFGGRENCASVRADTWVLQRANGAGGPPSWMSLAPSGPAIGARYGHTAVYDPGSNRMMVFGGRASADGRPFNDVWVLSNADGTGGTSNWSLLHPGGTPPHPRYGHSAAYDPKTNRMIIIGGNAGDGDGLSDAWILRNANGLGGPPTWVPLALSGNPPNPRWGQCVVYNTATNRLTLFGGEFQPKIPGTADVALNDTWVLQNANGTLPGTQSAVSADFNGTTIPEGAYIWFNSVMKLTGSVPARAVSIYVSEASITFTDPARGAAVTAPVPNATVVLDPSAHVATTFFINNAWLTRIPTAPERLAGENTFLAGATFPIGARRLPGGIKHVTWTASFATDTPGISLTWRWAAAVYSSLTDINSRLGVKATDDNEATTYRNADLAGTPEDFVTHLLPGATGNGGKNYTGSPSGAATVTPMVLAH